MGKMGTTNFTDEFIGTIAQESTQLEVKQAVDELKTTLSSGGSDLHDYQVKSKIGGGTPYPYNVLTVNGEGILQYIDNHRASYIAELTVQIDSGPAIIVRLAQSSNAGALLPSVFLNLPFKKSLVVNTNDSATYASSTNIVYLLK